MDSSNSRFLIHGNNTRNSARSIASSTTSLPSETLSFTSNFRNYGSIFNPFRIGNSKQNLQRSESMVSLCYRNLITFIEENNLQGLKIFLDSKRVAIDDRNENGSTALIVAASKGKLEFAQEIVNHGADVNAEDGDNWTALQCAAKEGHTDVVLFLLDHGADINHRDLGGWTPLMWASYKARSATAHLLMERGADVNAHGNYHISSLLWASGRGYTDIAINLIGHGAKVNIGDKYGTTALVWASRKGNAEIVEALLKAGANVDAAGMYSWTPLLVATLGNHVDVVNLLLAYKPNVNALDKDGCTALTIACKEGLHEIAALLINSGAYINIQDRVGDTNLIHAVKGGHRGVVEALLKKYAEVNTPGKDKKTALYWAVEKGNVQMVKILLSENPDLEASTKDGDTPLLRAVRTRNSEITQILLDKKAKVSAADKRGDTALHIAMRARSKVIVEILLRNPKHSQLLYRPNRAGETPYNLDMQHQKPILGQIFGARRLNTNEDNENMLGYDLYSSALADILSEPSLSMPITVGLYAKWGSGKSFLLSKLREEMKNFEAQWVEPLFTFTWLLFLIIVHIAVLIGLFVGLVTGLWLAGVCNTIILIIIIYGFLFFVRHSNYKFDWNWLYKINIYLSRKLKSLKLVLQVMFCHPPGTKASDENSTQHIKFYFTDQTRMSSTTGGENSVVQMVGSLYDSIESDYGSFPTRLYRAFRPRAVKSDTNWRWRRVCCLPYFLIFEICFIMSLVVISILVIYYFHLSDKSLVDQITLEVILGTLALLIGVSVVANLYTWGHMFKSIIFSQRRHLQKTISRLDTVKSEGFLQALRQEVSLMTDMVKCLDSFSTQQTRLVVIVDGLDSCEQDKVLLVLDAVHMLFSDSNSPFIVILAIDPHVISKAVEVNSLRLFSESDIGGHDYLRNMVHLPFYLQNSGLRKVKQAQQTAAIHRKTTGSGCNVSSWNESEEGLMQQGSTRRLSVHEGGDKSLKSAQPRKGSRKLKMSESIASSLGSNLNRIGGAQDLTKMILTDDYFSDVNPRSMRRLMNVVYIMGRLLKAFQVEFNWYHLASWINITEQWPFRTSWLILYYDMYEDSLDDTTSLKTIYDKVRPNIPISKDAEPYLELDRDEHKFDIFLTFHRNNLLVSDMKIFLPFTINLDPYLKKVIKEEQQNLEDGTPTMLIDQSFAPTSPSLSQMAWNNKNAHLLRRQQRPLLRGSSIQNSVAMNYPPISSQMMNWPHQNPWMMDPSTTMRVCYPVTYPTSPPVTMIPPSLLDIQLSSLSVDGVCDLFNKVDDLVPIGPKYFDSIKQNNISGRVLLHCDFQELKRVLNMTFGDWELFRMFIASLREQELTSVTNVEETSPKNVRFTVPKLKPGPSQTDRKISTNKISEERSSNKIATMEKQVTLEEQMISCALQTLNEEACEDVLDEVEEGLESTSTGLRTSSNDSDGFKGCARRPSQSSMNAGETEIVLLQNSPGHPSVWQQIESISAASSLSTTPVLMRKLSRGTNNLLRYSNSNLNTNGARSRPSSLLMFDDTVEHGSSQATITPPASPRMVTFRSNSIEGHQQEDDISINRPPSIQVSSLKMKQSPATSLEKLNRLKDKLLRTVVPKQLDHSDIETGMTDLGSDDESTPLVSESGTPAQMFHSNCSKTPSSEVSPLSPLSLASPNQQQPMNDPYHNSDLIDMTDKTNPIIPKDSNIDGNGCSSGGGGVGVGVGITCYPDGDGADDKSSSCGSSISLSHTLEKSNNFYHLVSVGGSMGSLGKLEQPWIPERKSSSTQLPRQNALDDEYNPETTV